MRPASRGGYAPVFLLTLILAPAVCGQPQPAEPLSRFQRLVQGLPAEEPAARLDFARAALRQLVEIYMAEADLARREAAAAGAEAGLQGWSWSVDQYAGQLLRLLNELDSGHLVERVSRPGSPAALSIAGQTVILTHPRPDQQQTLEQAVLAEYCARQRCEAGFEVPGKIPVPVTAGPVNPEWQFGDAGPVCSYGGLSVAFLGNRDLARRRETCRQLFGELLALETELRWQRRLGVPVEWQQLVLQSTPQRSEHLLRINRAGDAVLLAMPLFYASPGLLARAAPWLRLRLEGVERPLLTLQAAQFPWH